MRKLLKANFSRLRHDRVFWLLAALMVFFGASMAIVNAVNIRREGAVWMMDFSLLTYTTLAPILTSVLVALFAGSDYSGGTLRNKLIAGHRRGNIYLANLITCCCAGLLLCFAFVIPQGVLGPLLGGQIQSTPMKLLMYGALSLVLMIAFTALFTLIVMLCQNKSHTVAECILLVFVLIFLGAYITSALNEPEYLAGYSYTENGVTLCAIEKAWMEGRTPFRKPISCHLYPIRLMRFSNGTVGLNYHRWSVCAPARRCGAKLGIPVYKALREPIVRRFGEEFYRALEAAEEFLHEQER